MDFSAILNRLALVEVTLAGAQPGMADAAAALVAKQLRVADRDGVAVVQVVDDHGTVRIGKPERLIGERLSLSDAIPALTAMGHGAPDGIAIIDPRT